MRIEAGFALRMRSTQGIPKVSRANAGRRLARRLGPGEPKSIEPIAQRVAPGEKEQLHPFVAVSKRRT
jgi:hypothetical protein